MYKKSLLPILFGLFTIIFVASCDKDFNEIGTDIVGDDHFGFDVDTSAIVKAYNQKTGPIASNNLPVNALGFYNNPAFGETEANFVTQVTIPTTSLSPEFNNTNPDDYEHLPKIDSVVLDIPYFKKLLKTDDSGKKHTYRLDSIYGAKVDTISPAKFTLNVYQSGYFLRNLDPNASLSEIQAYYTDEKSTFDSHIIPGPNGRLNDTIYSKENDNFWFDPREHALKTLDDDGNVTDPTRTAPSMRLHLNRDFFYNKIFNAPAGALDSDTSFKNYFRGLYFKVSNPGSNKNMALMNFAGGTITIYYKEDKAIVDDPHTTEVESGFERTSKTYGLNLTGNCVNLRDYTNENANYVAAINSTSEASRLYLKGGEGSMAIIDLFSTTDVKGYTDNPNYNENLPINTTTNPKYLLVNSPNGVSDQIDDIKFNGWLINEANLTFYIDKPAMSDVKSVEPNRILLYDLTNKKPLVDYNFDQSANSVYPKYNKPTFAGFLVDRNGLVVKQIKDNNGDITSKGTKYKVRITNHLRNMIINDSTNVRLGLSVTEDIRNVELAKLRTPNSNSKTAPKMSVASPTGTVLYGTNNTTGQDYKYRLKLEIYYTKPNQD